MRTSRIVLRVLLAAAIILTVAATLWYALRPTASTVSVQTETFTLGTSILVAGYVLFPVLALLALGLLLIALMLLLGAAAERRRAAKDALLKDR